MMPDGRIPKPVYRYISGNPADVGYFWQKYVGNSWNTLNRNMPGIKSYLAAIQAPAVEGTTFVPNVVDR